jgi:hypothetical protein
MKPKLANMALTSQGELKCPGTNAKLRTLIEYPTRVGENPPIVKLSGLECCT